jgi:hypothetical protein
MIEETSAKSQPDPSVRTLEASGRAKADADQVDSIRQEALDREFALRQIRNNDQIEALKDKIKKSGHSSRRLLEAELRVVQEQFKGQDRILGLMETHRLELKSDSEKTLTTATIAAEKAVQAALAAAEKARDQQTIASQLATTKAEEASKEQLKQQGETFTTGIAGLSTGFNDVKTQLSELRAERRGGQEQVTVSRDSAADLKPILDAITELTKAQSAAGGAKAQVVESRAVSMQTIAVIALFATALGAVILKALGG